MNNTKDIIANDDISLDWSFKISLVTDLVKVSRHRLYIPAPISLHLYPCTYIPAPISHVGYMYGVFVTFFSHKMEYIQTHVVKKR